MQYEYKFVELLGGLSMTPREMEEDLNNFAAAGWKVISFDGSKRCALLERPVSGATHVAPAAPGGADVR